jgi:hypothetical protein
MCKCKNLDWIHSMYDTKNFFIFIFSSTYLVHRVITPGGTNLG